MIFRRDRERTSTASGVTSRRRKEHPASRTVIRERETVDAAVVAYVDWRAECIAVRDAYRSWTLVAAVDAELAYGAYSAALDREQAAAEVYAGLMREVGDLVESGLDYLAARRT